MKKILFDASNGCFKGNMHCHSTCSDGKQTPEELKALYKAHGYSFLAITDHDHLNGHKDLDDENFLTITSMECAIKEFPEQSTLVNQKMKVCHLNLYAKKQDNTEQVCYSPVYDKYSKGARREELKKFDLGYKRVYSAEGINDFIRIANEKGFFVAYNHPRWSLENYKQYSQYEGLWGVEVYNHACQRGGIYEYDINVHDDFLRDGKKVFLSVGDDNHSEAGSLGAFVMVNAPSLTYENIINALLEGKFYASRGPLIHALWVEDGSVHIRCSPVRMIGMSTEGRRHAARHAQGDALITEADFEIREDDGYIRLSIEDENGYRADTQAYFVKELPLGG